MSCVESQQKRDRLTSKRARHTCIRHQIRLKAHEVSERCMFGQERWMCHKLPGMLESIVAKCQSSPLKLFHELMSLGLYSFIVSKWSFRSCGFEVVVHTNNQNKVVVAIRRYGLNVEINIPGPIRRICFHQPRPVPVVQVMFLKS